MGKAKTAETTRSADITGREDMALTRKRKRGEKTDIDQGATGRKMTGEMRDTDHGELRTVMEKATSIAHGET